MLIVLNWLWFYFLFIVEIFFVGILLVLDFFDYRIEKGYVFIVVVKGESFLKMLLIIVILLIINDDGLLVFVKKSYEVVI